LIRHCINQEVMFMIWKKSVHQYIIHWKQQELIFQKVVTEKYGGWFMPCRIFVFFLLLFFCFCFFLPGARRRESTTKLSNCRIFVSPSALRCKRTTKWSKCRVVAWRPGAKIRYDTNQTSCILKDEIYFNNCRNI
jgi:hypothetical protein